MPPTRSRSRPTSEKLYNEFGDSDKKGRHRPHTSASLRMCGTFAPMHPIPWNGWSTRYRPWHWW
eukprot:12027428-Prorocentrum_lima.AAC.1